MRLCDKITSAHPNSLLKIKRKRKEKKKKKFNDSRCAPGGARQSQSSKRAHNFTANRRA
ncbi:hypothetical protein PUN28_015625 [Cardiocondyla obscurior]|uniref:Uncharacterized protein n=1 Tax=Cardiocondyla obscurior TaxID=286306 RepID=A0AAW2EYE0_9HYME